jgi:hypothetical protein
MPAPISYTSTPDRCVTGNYRPWCPAPWHKDRATPQGGHSGSPSILDSLNLLECCRLSSMRALSAGSYDVTVTNQPAARAESPRNRISVACNTYAYLPMRVARGLAKIGSGRTAHMPSHLGKQNEQF